MKVYDDEALEGTLVKLELGKTITDTEYFNLKKAIDRLRNLDKSCDSPHKA